MPRLAELLVLTGDLPSGEQAAAAQTTYGAPMVAAVKRFQAATGWLRTAWPGRGRSASSTPRSPCGCARWN